MPARSLIAVLFVLSLLAGSACGGVVGPSQNTIEEFSGIVDPNTAGPEHEFSVSRNGEFEIRFLALDPGAAILQVDFAQFVGDSCIQLIGTNIGSQNTIVLTGAISQGRYCVQVFDAGFIAEPVTYALRVSHP
jgi:hypothetical protein